MSISNNGVLVDLSISVWTGRKMDKKASADVDAANSTKTKAGAYHKNLFAGSDKLERIVSTSAKIRNWHLEQTLPWSDTGIRLLPMGNFFSYKQQLSAYEQEFSVVVADFVNSYPTLISAAAFQIGTLFNRDEYPDVSKVLSKFGIHYSFTPVPESGDFRVDADNETKQLLAEQYEKEYRTREETMAKELWDRLHGYLKLMSERLEKPELDAQGKPKRKPFHETHLTNGEELCSLLTRLNINSDPKLEQARKELEVALSGVTVTDIRKSEGTREEVKMRVNDILSKFDF